MRVAKVQAGNFLYRPVVGARPQGLPSEVAL
jgi:hypothetical protein